jgi:hypothetical protein
MLEKRVNNLTQMTPEFMFGYSAWTVLARADAIKPLSEHLLINTIAPRHCTSIRLFTKNL